MIKECSWTAENEPLDKSEDILVSFYARATELYIPEKPYLSNGEIGYPEEYDFEVTSLEEIEVLQWDDNLEKYISAEVTTDIKNKIQDLCLEKSDKFLRF